MSKLKTKSDVIEWYWIDYLAYCQNMRKSEIKEIWKEPTTDGFWLWYITDGPLGVKEELRFYNKTNVKYV